MHHIGAANSFQYVVVASLLAAALSSPAATYPTPLHGHPRHPAHERGEHVDRRPDGQRSESRDIISSDRLALTKLTGGDLSVTPVPEPSMAALALAGLGLLACVSRRRTRR